MTTVATVAARSQKSRSYNPFRFHRKLRRTSSTRDGRVLHVTKSFTRRDGEHRSEVNRETGALSCTCEDFRNRRARFQPHVFSPVAHLCKHNIRSLLGCARRRDITLSDQRVRELHREERARRSAGQRPLPPPMTRAECAQALAKADELRCQPGR